MYRRKDPVYLRAKSAGYRSRAAYKLSELDQRHHLFRPGDRVVDLGAWPGGWLQIAAAAVGPKGIVVGVDLQPIEPLGHANVRTFQGDVTDPEVVRKVCELCGGTVDVVLSDLAPKLSGIRARDEARGEALFSLATDFARAILRPGGTFVAKLFMSPSATTKMAELRARFGEVRSTRPDATRKGSAELYVIARGLRQSAPEDHSDQGSDAG